MPSFVSPPAALRFFTAFRLLPEMPRQDTQDPSKEHGAVLTEISDGMVALLKEYYGVGPTQAKTYYHDDLVVCVLRGGFTRVEQTLLDGDRGRAVIDQRMAFQEVMRQRFEAVIQHATGRPVIGFMSGNQQDPDMICDVFVLSPTDLFEEQEIRAGAEARSGQDP
jgi:uncharacterized protein YbcI